LANRQGGDVLGEISRARSALSAANDKIGDLRAQLADAEAKRDRAQGNVEFWAQRLAAVNDSVSRSVTVTGGPDLLAPAKAAHAEYVAASRAAWSAATSGTPRERRPFARRGAGHAVRSEHCTWCTEFSLTDQESYLLHSDPELAVPVTPPGTVPEAEQARQVRAEQAREARADRHQYGSYAEISR
jgi:hypothetical protein